MKPPDVVYSAPERSYTMGGTAAPQIEWHVLYAVPGRGLLRESRLSEAERAALGAAACWGQLGVTGTGHAAVMGCPFPGAGRRELLALAKRKARYIVRKPYWVEAPREFFLYLAVERSHLALLTGGETAV